MTIQCEHCGELLPDESRKVRRRYCSDRCRYTAKNMRRVRAAPRTCPTCGATFQPTGTDKFCSVPCRNVARNERRRKPVNVRPVPTSGIPRRAGEPAVIMPTDYVPPRAAKMTDDEMELHLAKIRRELTEAGLPLIDHTWRTKNVRGMGVQG